MADGLEFGPEHTNSWASSLPPIPDGAPAVNPVLELRKSVAQALHAKLVDAAHEFHDNQYKPLAPEPHAPLEPLKPEELMAYIDLITEIGRTIKPILGMGDN
jgi:hypothetical protein